MAYSVKEMVFTLQGEGAHTGKPAVFLRFTGCNLWSGLEQDRATAVCNFCDTDFVGTNGAGGGKFLTAQDLAGAVARLHPHTEEPYTQERWVVCTGGEPLLQLDSALIEALHAQHLLVAVETNGTLPLPENLDWVCVSPKAGSHCLVNSGNELKLVYPQTGVNPADFLHWKFEHFFLQPCDGPQYTYNMRLVVNYCLSNAPWRVSLQTHKILGIP
jgi:7-carboxy-7-deazaguanine synthase